MDRSSSDLDDAIADADDVAVAAITAAELRVGVFLSRSNKRALRQAFLEDVLSTIPVVVYDLAVAEAHAELLLAMRNQGTPRGAHNLMIAASAKATQRTVLTADTSAFAGLPGIEVRHHR